ncbi:MAG: hydroxymethylglutaryl-CoA reductase, degradative [Promethearchaeota archaeon]
MVDTSRLEKFYRKDLEGRIDALSQKINISDGDIALLKCDNSGEMLKVLDGMIENVIGIFPVPLGIATNFIINGKERLITMAIEEPSVVAAASNIARMARSSGGFKCDPVESFMIGQLQVLDVSGVENVIAAIHKEKDHIISKANEQDPILVKLGGGAKDLQVSECDTNMGKMLDVHLIVNCLDAMGANAVNTMVEAIAPLIEEITGARVLLKIISNLAVHRIARCKATFDKEMLGGDEVVKHILEAVEFANNTAFRATTHNKGVMNGITAVVLATGNDTRAIEAGVHGYASYSGTYRPVTKFSRDDSGNLIGEIEVPAAMGIVGGATKSNPVSQLCLKIMEIDSAESLSQTIAAVGLAQNLAALRALASEGIQKGHMKLHAKNIMKMAGVPPEFFESLLPKLLENGKIRVDVAKKIYEDLIKEGK